jgi:DNA-binding NarL/FixJ family response regulator
MSVPPPAESRLDRFRVVIVNKSQLVIDQIAAAVSEAFQQVELTICRSAAEALAALRLQPAHLGVFGLTLPDMDGLDLLARLGAERRVFRILVVSSRRDERTRQWMRPGRVDGFLDPAREGFASLVQAIRAIGDGRVWFQREEVEKHGPRHESPRLDQMFTALEQRVLVAIGDGADDRVAAAELKMSAHAVHSHRVVIMRKLEVHTRPELMRECIRRGVIRITHDRVLRPGSNCDIVELDP